jgi:hypothetical protein
MNSGSGALDGVAVVHGRRAAAEARGGAAGRELWRMQKRRDGSGKGRRSEGRSGRGRRGGGRGSGARKAAAREVVARGVQKACDDSEVRGSARCRAGARGAAAAARPIGNGSGGGAWWDGEGGCACELRTGGVPCAGRAAAHAVGKGSSGSGARAGRCGGGSSCGVGGRSGGACAGMEAAAHGQGCRVQAGRQRAQWVRAAAAAAVAAAVRVRVVAVVARHQYSCRPLVCINAATGYSD